jgi:F-type H+-transporting ATPase subunit b
MEIIKNFGINPILLIAQIVNFLILLFLLKKFAYKPIFEMLEKRKKEIADGLKSAEEGKLELEKALDQEKKMLKKAQGSSQQLILDAKSQADQMLIDAKESTKLQVEEMLSEARSQMKKDSTELERKLALSSAKLAVEMLEKSIKDIFSQKEQQEVVEKVTKKLKISKN